MIPTTPPDPPRGGRHALPRLVVEVTGDHLRTVVCPYGEVDIATAELLAGYGMQALAQRPSRLVVDMSAVTFFSAAGLRVLAHMQQAAEAEAVDFRLRAPSSIVRLVLSAARHRLRFPLEEDSTGPSEAANATPAVNGTPGLADASGHGARRSPRHKLY
jgi:anti-anti-sigma factor